MSTYVGGRDTRHNEAHLETTVSLEASSTKKKYKFEIEWMWREPDCPFFLFSRSQTNASQRSTYPRTLINRQTTYSQMRPAICTESLYLIQMVSSVFILEKLISIIFNIGLWHHISTIGTPPSLFSSELASGVCCSSLLAASASSLAPSCGRFNSPADA